jgi:membrane-bound lytic murein transglycosylase B
MGNRESAGTVIGNGEWGIVKRLRALVSTIPHSRFSIPFLLCLCITSTAADYSDNPKTPQLLEELQTKYGFSAGDLAGVRSALKEAQQLPQLIVSEQTSKEKVLSWEDYKPLHVTPANIANGLVFMRDQKHWLDLAQERFGVPPEVVTALLGVETKYGAYTGKYRVLDALATLGYDHPTRAPFFFGELLQFFVMCREQGFRPDQPLGSYAGAMGMAQFMPSNYRNLAVDFDGDGRADLWSPADAIGSIANYLVSYDPQRSWHRGQAMLAGVDATARPPAEMPRNAKVPQLSIGALRQAGIRAPVGLDAELPAGLVELSHDNGTPEFWIALPNFFAVMSYNPRVFYAMSVASLAYELKLAEDSP